jgi:wyosine [tRNA(Phe)-imidazoG37] synthetase (radical SAM superfamily)
MAKEPIHKANFRAACLMAKQGQTTTVLITGKGEPTLFPLQVSDYLFLLEPHQFPFIELQTNGIAIGHLAAGNPGKANRLTTEILKDWRKYGLTTIALSVVSTDNEANARIYNPDYPDLSTTIRYLRELDFTVRLCVMMMHGEGCVSTPKDVRKLLEFCRENDVAQLTVRPINAPGYSHDEDTARFVHEHTLTLNEMGVIREWVQDYGHLVMTMSHGAEIYDVEGQNISLTDCLSPPQGKDELRTLIVDPSGRVTYDWQYPGAILLSGRARKA